MTNTQLAEKLHQAGCHAMAKLVAARPESPPIPPEADAKLNEIFGIASEPVESEPAELSNVERDD